MVDNRPQSTAALDAGDPLESLLGPADDGGGLGLDPEMLARAEAVVAGMADNFAVSALQDLALMRDAFAAAQASEGPERADHVMTGVYRKAHEFKGMGTTFGYPLITRVGASLCLYLKGLKDAAKADDRVVAAHIDAIAALLAEDVTDEHDADGVRLAEGLEKVVSHA